MPLYLVRWPGLEASIVRADDEDHLTEILDEVASPTEASWVEYNGPLWIDIGVGFETERAESGEWTISGTEKVTEEPWFGAAAQVPDTDAAEEMMGNIFESAFPNLSQIIERSEGNPVDAGAIRTAALRDLAEHKPSGLMPPNVRSPSPPRGRHGNGGG